MSGNEGEQLAGSPRQGGATYKSGGVVVTGGFSVSVSLEHRVSLDNLVLKSTLLGLFPVRVDRKKVNISCPAHII